MPRDPLIGLVGKPSSGKSTTLNSLTDATSKVGNFPFTTIDPQRAIGYLQVPCACSRYSLSERCKPNYGSCTNGTRSVPIELLDVAGLVPGAHQGKGLGNKFLDDLRHADALIHVVDVSGTTDAEGKETRGYDPSQDIVWLRSEIVSWIEGNLLEKWGSIKRRHIAIKATAAETLQNQFSGYGSNLAITSAALAKLSTKVPLEAWDESTVHSLVSAFVDVKFPTVLALNKIDHADADANIAKIAKTHPPESLVLTSAISEVFLRRLVRQGYILYIEGSDQVETFDDIVEAEAEAEAETESDATAKVSRENTCSGTDVRNTASSPKKPPGGGLKPLDDKLRTRIENLRDMVLFRYGSTGVVQVLTRAAELLGLVPVFPVRSTHHLTTAAASVSSPTASSSASGESAVFRDCVLVKRGTSVREVARKVIGDAPLAYVEGPGGVRVSEDEAVGVGKYDVSFKIPLETGGGDAE